MSTRFDQQLLALGGIQVVGSFGIPSGVILASHVAASAGLEATKLQHQHVIGYSQADGSDVVDAIVPVYTCRGVTATIIEVEVSCLDAPSGGDKKFTVDLKKANAGSPTPATVLSAVVDYSATRNDCEVVAGIIVSAALVVGDTIVVVVAVSGSTGTQGQGLIVTVTVREDAE